MIALVGQTAAGAQGRISAEYDKGGLGGGGGFIRTDYTTRAVLRDAEERHKRAGGDNYD